MWAWLLPLLSLLFTCLFFLEYLPPLRRVRLPFADPGLRIGAWISAMTLLGVVVALRVKSRHKRKRA